MGKRFARVLLRHMMRERVNYTMLAARVTHVPREFQDAIGDDIPRAIRALARGQNPNAAELVLFAKALNMMPQDFLWDMYQHVPLLQDGCLPDFLLEEFEKSAVDFLAGAISNELRQPIPPPRWPLDVDDDD